MCLVLFVSYFDLIKCVFLSYFRRKKIILLKSNTFSIPFAMQIFWVFSHSHAVEIAMLLSGSTTLVQTDNSVQLLDG